MTFTWPVLLWLLLLAPLVVLLEWRAALRRRHTSRAFADPHLLPSLLRSPPAARMRWLTALYAAAFAALLFAGARPVAAPPLPTNKAAVVIALDASQSMLADDVDPSRLEAARALAEAFVEKAPAGAKIGLVSFSDLASVLVPPTINRQMLLDALEGVEPAQNTSLVDAVVTGVKMLPGREEAEPPGALARNAAALPGTRQQRGPDEPDAGVDELPPGSLLIFSDGVSNVGGAPGLPEEAALELAAGFAADQRVKLYTVPVGVAGGAVSRIDGQDYFVPFEPDRLQRMSELSDGKSVTLDDAGGLEALAYDLGRDIRWEKTELEVSSLFVGLAVLLMAAAGGLSLRWYRRVP